MDLALWLHHMGLTAPVAALAATLGVVSVLTLAGVAVVALLERGGPHSHRNDVRIAPRGATRLSPRPASPSRQR